MVTVIADRESDIYAQWARLPAPGFHLLTRVQKDRRLHKEGMLYAFGANLPVAGTRLLELRARPLAETGGAIDAALWSSRAAPARRHRRAQSAGQCEVELCRSRREQPPSDSEPLHWRLLTTHPLSDAKSAWQIVDWYAQRWMIEQLFRVMKLQGFKIEDSQLDTADRLLKLIAIAAKAAVLTLQLVQARDGNDNRPANLAFGPEELDALDALNARIEGQTPCRKILTANTASLGPLGSSHA